MFPNPRVLLVLRHVRINILRSISPFDLRLLRNIRVTIVTGHVYGEWLILIAIQEKTTVVARVEVEALGRQFRSELIKLEYLIFKI